MPLVPVGLTHEHILGWANRTTASDAAGRLSSLLGDGLWDALDPKHKQLGAKQVATKTGPGGAGRHCHEPGDGHALGAKPNHDAAGVAVTTVVTRTLMARPEHDRQAHRCVSRRAADAAGGALARIAWGGFMRGMQPMKPRGRQRTKSRYFGFA